MNRQLLAVQCFRNIQTRNVRGIRKLDFENSDKLVEDDDVTSLTVKNHQLEQNLAELESHRVPSIEQWPDSYKINLRPKSESKYQDRVFHPFFDKGRGSLDLKGRRAKDERKFPSYYYKPSLENASINKHTYKLMPKSRIFHRYYDAEKQARRKLPVPVSLTGIGFVDDVKGVRYWKSKIERSIEELENQTVSSKKFLDKVTPAVKFLIENKLLGQQYDPITNNYFKELKLEEEEDKEVQKTSQQFPYQLTTQIKERLLSKIDEKNIEEGSTDLELYTETESSLLDQEFQEYQKHQSILKYVSSHVSSLSMGRMKAVEFESELEAWKDEFWRRSYGSPDETIPPSNTPCGGCGANLHCTNPSIPGYVSSQVFKKTSNKGLKKLKCTRCGFLEHFNVSLDVTVEPEDYPKIISTIRDTQAIVILMVDLLDFPASVWPNIFSMVGQNRKIYIVGNKVDLLPSDSKDYLERVEKCLKSALSQAGISPQKINIRSLNLISAKTGFGVEPLITKLLSDRRPWESIYLLGCTNVGKSTLFNQLLQSDICALRENDLIHRATTSLWPGTTLNTLKFPIKKLEGWQLKLRQDRLRLEQRYKTDVYKLQMSMWKQNHNPTISNLVDRIGTTFRSNLEFSRESNHPFAKRSANPKPFNEKDEYYKQVKFFYDTPGTIYHDQILTLLTTEELLKTVPRTTITPRTFSLQPFQTLFVAGLGRIDVVHSRQNVLMTVFCSNYLPIHVVYTHEADAFYDIYVGSKMLGVPFGDQERMSKWPALEGQELDITGIDRLTSAADVVLSSAGWVSITPGREEQCVLKAYTPQRRGMFVRTPAMLPFAVQMRGRRIHDTPCFETKVFKNTNYEAYIRESNKDEANRKVEKLRMLEGLRKDLADPMNAAKLRKVN